MDPAMINLCIHVDKKIIQQRTHISLRYGSKKAIKGLLIPIKSFGLCNGLIEKASFYISLPSKTCIVGESIRA